MVQVRNVKMKRRTVEERIKLLENTARHGKSEFFKLLSLALSDRSPSVRDEAVLLVTEHRLKRAAPLVEPLLYDDSEDVRYDAAECIGILQKGRNSSPPGLKDLLRDRSAVVRAQAVESLALLEDRSALPNVVLLLSDENPVVRSYAASMVGMLGGRAYLKIISRSLSRENHDLARIGLYEALFLLGKRKVLPAMLMLLESSDYRVRCSVANTLEVMPLRDAEVKVAIRALVAANRKPRAVADETTTRRVLQALSQSITPPYRLAKDIRPLSVQS
jgi:HEAT repeat protein